MDERRYCVVCGHDITAWRKSAKTCGHRCRLKVVTASPSHRSSSSFQAARSRGAKIDPDFTVQRLTEMIRARGNCYLCDAPLVNEYHIDHIFPLIRGGKHEEANIGFLCPTCNEHKGRRTVAEYLDYLAKYDSPRVQRILDRAPLILASSEGVADDDGHVIPSSPLAGTSPPARTAGKTP